MIVNFTPEETNETRATALFAADKYRKAYEILDRFADENVADIRASCNEFVAIAHGLHDGDVELSPGQLRLLDQAFSGFLRDMNRRLQIVSARCDSEQERAIREEFVIATGAAAKITSAIAASAPAETAA